MQSVEYSNFRDRASLPSLQNRCLQDIAILMYKVKHGMVPAIRNKDFHIPRFNETFYQVLYPINIV